MRITRSIIVLYCSLAIFCQSLRAQQVWPGDINNNGIVNSVDLLYWGVAFGSSGPARAEISTDWQGIPLATPWAQNFPNGINYAYADCNGSGLVDEDDFDDAIEPNYGLTNGPLLPDGYVNGQAGEAPRLRLRADATEVNFGTSMNISLSLDNNGLPLGDFYGLAAKFTYTADVLDEDLDFDFEEDNWIEADNSYVEDLFVENQDLGKAELAVSRTNQQNIPAQDTEFGRFSIVIEDIIVGRGLDTFQLTIDSILVINKDLGTIEIAPDTVTIIISDGTVATSSPWKTNSKAIKVYPNPVSGEFYLESEVPLRQSGVQLLDQLGRSYPVQARLLRPGTYLLEKPNLPAGIYCLSVRTDEGWNGKKIILL